MKKRIANLILIVLILHIFLNITQATESIDNNYSLLFITGDSVLSGDSVTEMISDIGKAYNLSVTNVQVDSSSSLRNELTNSDTAYTDIILQDTYENLFNSNWSAISELESVSNSNCYIGTPWKELTGLEKETIFTKCNSLLEDSSIKGINRVYANLLEVKEAGIEVANSAGELTRAGELALACTYITEITKTPITGLTSYDGISDKSVETIVKKVNETMSTPESLLNSTNENTANTTNTTNTINTTTKATSKTTKKVTTATGTLKANSSSFKYIKFKCDREPRLVFITSEPEYLHVKIKDCGGIKCEHTGDTKNQPKVYVCADATGKNKKEIKDLKRCKKAEYASKQGTEYVYELGIPSKYIGDKKTYFYIVGYDINSNVIREYIGVTRKNDGTYSTDRSPRSCAVTTEADKTKIGFFATDYSGISTVKVRTVKDKDVDVLGQWNGTIQNNWSQVESVTASKKNMISAITSMNKVSTFFKNRTWKGKNPKVSGKNGVYRFVIETKDAGGLVCVKTMAVNTTQINVGNKYQAVTTTKKTTKKSVNNSSTKKSKSNSLKETSANNAYERIKNTKSSSGYIVSIDYDRNYMHVFKGEVGSWKLIKSFRVVTGKHRYFGNEKYRRANTNMGTFHLSGYVNYNDGALTPSVPLSPKIDMRYSNHIHGYIINPSPRSRAECKTVGKDLVASRIASGKLRASQGCIELMRNDAIWFTDYAAKKGTKVVVWTEKPATSNDTFQNDKLKSIMIKNKYHDVNQLTEEEKKAVNK